MSDRVNVAFKTGDDYSPILYSRYHGYGTPASLADFQEKVQAWSPNSNRHCFVLAAHFAPYLQAGAISNWLGSEEVFFRECNIDAAGATIVDVSCSIWIARTRCRHGLITWTVGQHTDWESIHGDW